MINSVDLTERLKEKVKQEQTGYLDNDDEYYFIIGQLVKFFEFIQITNKRLHNSSNPIMQTSNEKVRNKLLELFKRNSNRIFFKHKRFNNAYSMVLGYQTNGNINQDMMILGYTSENIIINKTT